MIATLGTGVYLSDYSGKSHVGIFLWKTKDALVMLDQYKGGKGKVGIRVKPFNQGYDEKPVQALRYLDPKFGYREPFIDKNGQKAWRHNFSLKTVTTRVDLTGDGSEYYILLDDGSVARRDSPHDVLRTAEEQKQAVRAFVGELFEGVNVGGSKEAGAKLREALEGVKPVTAAPPPLQPR